MQFLKYLTLFLWLLIPLGLWQAIQTHGTPHLVVSYRFLDNGDPYNPLAHRHYTECTYWGWHGLRRLPAQDARCPWVRMLKS